MTEAELKAQDFGKSESIVSYGCLVIFFGIAPILLLGQIGAWLAKKVPGQPISAARGIGWIVGVSILVYALTSLHPHMRKQRARDEKDAAKQQVEEIVVTQARVVELASISENEPIVAFDIGAGKILFLQGQWLWDHRTFGAPAQEGDPPEEFLNQLPAPWSFPSTAFTVTRLPESGKVLGIRVQGDYLAPGKPVEALEEEFDFRDSELFGGEIEDIAGVLRRAG